MKTLARHRSTVLIAVVAILAIVLTAYLGRNHRVYPAALDPENPDGTGARAVAQVLAHEGVDVDIVRSADALDKATTDGPTTNGATTNGSTTIVVTSSGNLGPSTTTRLLTGQGDAWLVVLAPGPRLVSELGVGSYAVSSLGHDRIDAGCPAYDGLTLDVPAAIVFSGGGCFPARGGSVFAEPRAGLTLVGAPAALTNDQVLDGDNAAVALRLLGQRDHLVWYVPDLADLAGGDSVSASSLLPHWLKPALWLLFVTGIGLVVWRARRLGPLAREPLPVQVKAVETTRNLGRLYRRSGDRGHAAESLRAAARVRLSDRLGLPRQADPARLTTAVAERTGRERAEIDTLLLPGSAPAHDRDLATLAHQLTELDREVSHP